MEVIAHLRKDFTFEASHQLPNHDGKCARLHGHSWNLSVWVSGEISEKVLSPKEGMVQDFSVIKAIVGPIVEQLDHYHLGYGAVYSRSGQLITLQAEEHLRLLKFPQVPTSENIALWIISQFPPTFNWQCVELSETCTSACRIYSNEYKRDKFLEQHYEGIKNEPVTNS